MGWWCRPVLYGRHWEWNTERELRPLRPYLRTKKLPSNLRRSHLSLLPDGSYRGRRRSGEHAHVRPRRHQGSHRLDRADRRTGRHALPKMRRKPLLRLTLSGRATVSRSCAGAKPAWTSCGKCSGSMTPSTSSMFCSATSTRPMAPPASSSPSFSGISIGANEP
jgi:hypothetical protein